MVTFVTIAQDDREGWRGDASERSRRVTKRRRAAFRLRSGQAALQKAGGKFGTGERVVRDPPISGTGVHTADFDCCTQNDKVKPRNSRSLTPVARRDWVRDDKRKAKPRNFAPFLNLRYKNHQSHPSQTARRSGCGSPVESTGLQKPEMGHPKEHLQRQRRFLPAAFRSVRTSRQALGMTIHGIGGRPNCARVIVRIRGGGRCRIACHCGERRGSCRRATKKMRRCRRKQNE
jgi:hypothetical protein